MMSAKVARTAQLAQGKRIATEQKACPVPAMRPYMVLKDIPDADFFHGPVDGGNSCCGCAVAVAVLAGLWLGCGWAVAGLWLSLCCG
jgi:hypothetical protein